MPCLTAMLAVVPARSPVTMKGRAWHALICSRHLLSQTCADRADALPAGVHRLVSSVSNYDVLHDTGKHGKSWWCHAVHWQAQLSCCCSTKVHLGYHYNRSYRDRH